MTMLAAALDKWGAIASLRPVRGSANTRPAPPPGLQSEVEAALRKYALGHGNEKREVSQTREGGRNDRLNIAAALKLGELIAAHVLTEREDAAEACGLARDDGWKSVRDPIDSAAGRAAA